MDVIFLKPESMHTFMVRCSPFNTFLCVLLRESICMFASGTFSSTCNSLFMLFIHSVCSFYSHILLERCFVFFASGYWFVFVHFSLICWQQFSSLFGKSCFVCIALFGFSIFLVSIPSTVSFELFFQVVLLWFSHSYFLIFSLQFFSCIFSFFITFVCCQSFFICPPSLVIDYWPHLYCHNHNVLADMSFSLLQVFHVELGSPHRISNWTLYLNHRSRLFQFYLRWPGTRVKL